MFYGYKCFQKGLINRYGDIFQVGKWYRAFGDIQFGNNGNGFHVCSRLEDTLRYFDCMNSEVNLTKVRCYGNYSSYEDDYYGYYDMYAYEYMMIDKILNRDDIINYALDLNEITIKRFLSLYRLNDKEKEIILHKYKDNIDVLKTFFYYQEDNKDIYNLENNVLKYVKKLKI